MKKSGRRDHESIPFIHQQLPSGWRNSRRNSHDVNGFPITKSCWFRWSTGINDNPCLRDFVVGFSRRQVQDLHEAFFRQGWIPRVKSFWLFRRPWLNNSEGYSKEDEWESPKSRTCSNYLQSSIKMDLTL